MTTKEPVGSVAEEAAKLFALLQQHKGGDEHAPSEPDPAPVPEPGHGGHRLGPECQWCPVCQLLALVRQARPETVDHLATAAAGVLGSVRALLDAATESARQARAAAEAQDEKARASKAEEARTDDQKTGVDRIDVSEDPEPWD